MDDVIATYVEPVRGGDPAAFAQWVTDELAKIGVELERDGLRGFDLWSTSTSWEDTRTWSLKRG